LVIGQPLWILIFSRLARAVLDWRDAAHGKSVIAVKTASAVSHPAGETGLPTGRKPELV
jgi:hypothetical protein